MKNPKFLYDEDDFLLSVTYKFKVINLLSFALIFFEIIKLLKAIMYIIFNYRIN